MTNKEIGMIVSVVVGRGLGLEQADGKGGRPEAFQTSVDESRERYKKVV